jgi:hypothetical protein
LIGVATRHLALRFNAVEHGVAPRIHHQQFPRAEAAALQDVGRVEIGHADLGAGDHEVAPGDLVAAGAEPVPVDRRARDDAVGEGKGGRAIPGLHQRSVILVEAPEGGIEVGRALPRLGDQHHQGVHGVAPRAHQQREGVVEAR